MPNGGVEALIQMQNDLYGSSSDEDNALFSMCDLDDHLSTLDLSVDDELLCPTCCSGPDESALILDRALAGGDDPPVCRLSALTLDCALSDDDDPPVPRLLGLCPCSLSLLSLGLCLCEGGGRCACMCPQCRFMDMELGGILDQGLDQSLCLNPNLRPLSEPVPAPAPSAALSSAQRRRRHRRLRIAAAASVAHPLDERNTPAARAQRARDVETRAWEDAADLVRWEEARDRDVFDILNDRCMEQQIDDGDMGDYDRVSFSTLSRLHWNPGGQRNDHLPRLLPDLGRSESNSQAVTTMFSDFEIETAKAVSSLCDLAPLFALVAVRCLSCPPSAARYQHDRAHFPRRAHAFHVSCALWIFFVAMCCAYASVSSFHSPTPCPDVLGSLFGSRLSFYATKRGATRWIAVLVVFSSLRGRRSADIAEQDSQQDSQSDVSTVYDSDDGEAQDLLYDSAEDLLEDSLYFSEASWEILGDNGEVHGLYSTAELHEWLMSGILTRERQVRMAVSVYASAPNAFGELGDRADIILSLSKEFLNASAVPECSCALRGIAEALEWPLQRPCGFCCWCRCYCAGTERVGHTGLLQAASEHPVARLLLDNYYDQIAGGGGSPQ